MKADHEEAIRPYRDLMESTKGRSDDDAKSLAENRRAVKVADQQVADAAKRREQRIANANRAVDNAQERLRKVESELSSLQNGGNASPSAIQKMQSEIVTERAHLDAARDEVARTTAECQQLVDNAQTHLWTQKQSLETAERQASEAKREADARREEYERLYNSALAEEKAIEDEIALRQRAIAETGKEQAESERRQSEAQALLDEANEIHATPEVTQQLRQGIAEGQASLERQESEVNSLARSERRIRETTRTQRYIFIGAAVAVLAVVVLLVWFFAVPH
jgi:chromosome segregation ATPase